MNNLLNGPRRDPHDAEEPVIVCVHLLDNPKMPAVVSGFSAHNAEGMRVKTIILCKLCNSLPEKPSLKMLSLTCGPCFKAAQATGEHV